MFTPWNDRLRNRRIEDGLTQPALGERLGVSQNRVSDFEKGAWPSRSPETQAAIAAYLGEELGELRREANNHTHVAEDELDDLRALASELRESNAAILEALGKTLDRLTEIASAIDQLGRQGS